MGTPSQFSVKIALWVMAVVFFIGCVDAATDLQTTQDALAWKCYANQSDLCWAYYPLGLITLAVSVLGPLPFVGLVLYETKVGTKFLDDLDERDRHDS